MKLGTYGKYGAIFIENVVTLIAINCCCCKIEASL